MGKWKVWLIIALALWVALSSWTLLGGKLWNATKNVCKCDTSEHKVSFVTVEPGVQLEVLDWGGTGQTLVLLTGIGDNAHVFDEFAYQFTDRFHVIGITRRGFGRSSQPAHGYDLDTRARDDIAVLDKLNIRDAVFVGHSVAGTELNKIGAAYPDRVRKLVYLDALDLGSGGWATLPQPPPPPDDTPADLESVQRFAAASARSDGYRKPLAAICNMVRTDSSGRVIGAVTPPEISKKILKVYSPLSTTVSRLLRWAFSIESRLNTVCLTTGIWTLPNKRNSIADIESLAKWIDGAIQRFRSGVKNSRVIELHDTNHYVFIVDEALVVRETRKFVLDE